MVFLRAEWRRLILANYIVDPQILTPYLPYGTVLDPWQGHHYVSLVGFLFLRTRVLGIPIPFHINFPEVNLRFYVRRQEGGEWKRGVVFIREIVPKHAISFVANTLYGEHYKTRPMKHQWEEYNGALNTSYAWKETGIWQFMSVRSGLNPEAIEPGSDAEFFTEHYWGYTKRGVERTTEYRVDHPRWEVYPVEDHEIRVEFGFVYGPDFQFLVSTPPESVVLAEGSPIRVDQQKKIRG